MQTSNPSIGEKAPPVEGPTQTGDTLRLDAYRGQRVALYFYPKDGTSGCTQQAQSLRDGYQRLEDAGIAVVGVSADDVASHEHFADELDLPFPLVADPDHGIPEAYGVWGELELPDRTIMGIHRTTFLIDEEGVVQDVIEQPNTGAHADEVLERFG